MIKNGDRLMCISEHMFIDRLTVGKVYKVITFANKGFSSSIVKIIDDSRCVRWYDFVYFKTLELHRNDIIDGLLK